MREFYLRRIQRLLPNAVATVLITVALTSIFLLPSDVVKVARHGLWTAFNLSNIYIWRNVGGYWADSAASAPLLHTWSLAVEEQFYLAFPVTLWFMARGKRPHILPAMACLVLASFGLNVYGTWTHPAANFYLLPTRAWEPLLGAALAAYRVPVTATLPLRSIKLTWVTEVAGWAGLAMIVAGFFLVTEDQGFPGLIALLPTVGALAVLVSIADGEGQIAHLLARPFLVLVGKLSYSLYLWHWPLIVIGRTYADLIGQSPQAGALVGASLGGGLSALAYWAIEKPLRFRGPGRGRRLLVIAASFSFCAVVSLLVSLRHPIADPLGVFDRPTFQGELYSVIGDGSPEGLLAATRYFDVLIPPPQHRPADAWRTGGLIHDWGASKLPRVVVLGSSHALMYGALIDDICKRVGVSVAFLCADGTSVFFQSEATGKSPSLALAPEFDAARKKWLNEWNPDLVLAIDRWDYKLDPQGPLAFERRLPELVRDLEPYTRRILLFSQVPVLRLGENVNLREFATWYLRRMGSLPLISPDPNEPIRRFTVAVMEEVVRDHPKVQLLRADLPFYLNDGSVRYSSGRSFLYADDDHLSEAGAELLREPLTRTIVDACSLTSVRPGASSQRAVMKGPDVPRELGSIPRPVP